MDAFIHGYLLKLAEELEYRRVGNFELARGIPVLQTIPESAEDIKKHLIKMTDPLKTRARDVLGYKNIAIRVSDVPNLESLGFKKTRLATPLPGEKTFTPSFRLGRLHAHRQGPVYLVHQDKHAPMSARFGYFTPGAVVHGIREGVPSIVKRIKERVPLVRVLQDSEEAVEQPSR